MSAFCILTQTNPKITQEVPCFIRDLGAIKMKTHLLILSILLLPYFGEAQATKTDSIVDYISSIELYSISSLKYLPIDSLCKGRESNGLGYNEETRELQYANHMTNINGVCSVTEYFYHRNALIFILIGSNEKKELDNIYVHNSQIESTSLNAEIANELVVKGMTILNEYQLKNKTAPNTK